MSDGATPVRVEVTWADAQDHDETWTSLEDVEEFAESSMIVTSLGWEVKRTKLYITIAADYTPDGTFGRVCKIPMGMVQKIEQLIPTPNP